MKLNGEQETVLYRQWFVICYILVPFKAGLTAYTSFDVDLLVAIIDMIVVYVWLLCFCFLYTTISLNDPHSPAHDGM
jgi:hypothetical protein